MGGGGSSGPSQQQVTTTNLPEYARPYYERLMKRGEAQSNVAYQPYSGDRISGFSPDSYAGFDITRSVAQNGTPDLASARSALGASTQTALDTTGFVPGQVQTRGFDGAAANQYMSPYWENVVNRQQDSAVTSFNRGRAGRDQQAIQSGAFGGERAAIQEGMAQQGLQRQLGDIYAQGAEKAFGNAQQQFERDRSAFLGVDQFNEGSRQKAAQIEQAGAALGMQGAQGFAGLGDMQQRLDFQQADALTKVGQAEEGMTQRGLDLAYQDFINQRDYPRQNLQFLSSLLRGVPISAQSEVATYQNPNTTAQLMGLGIGGLGLYNAATRSSQ